MTIELNDLFKQALDLLENGNKSVFITGKAGTGKSTLLQYFREHTKKKIVVLAPTGVFLGEISGEFEARQLPTEIELKLKNGAQIMLNEYSFPE